MRKKLKKLLTNDNIFLELEADSKETIIEELIDRLVGCGKIKDREAVMKAVLEREKKCLQAWRMALLYLTEKPIQ